MITSLTPEQEAMIPVMREEWRAIGLNTAPVDPDKAKETILNLYKAAGVAKVPVVFQLPSPLACLYVRTAIRSSKKVASLLMTGENNELACQIGEYMMYKTGNLPKDLQAEVKGLKVEHQTPWLLAGMDAPWVAFYHFMEYIGVKFRNAEHFAAYREYVKHGGICFPYEEAVLMSDRILEMHWDENRRLHNAAGMSVKFRDGFGWYTWHGTRIPGWFITNPEKVTMEAVTKESNQELKRILSEIMGPEKRKQYATLISEDKYGKLWRTPVGSDTILEVEVINGSPEPDGTFKTYYLDVSSAEENLGWRIKTPLDAVAATYGLKAKDYEKLKQRT